MRMSFRDANRKSRGKSEWGTKWGRQDLQDSFDVAPGPINAFLTADFADFYRFVSPQ
jgi:hypothetical protein